MRTQFQDIDWVIVAAQKDLSKNKNRRISALFRDLRKNKRYSLLGDYFILWSIAKAMDNLGMDREKRQDQFSRAARQSLEYKLITRKEKSEWVARLTKPRLAQ